MNVYKVLDRVWREYSTQPLTMYLSGHNNIGGRETIEWKPGRTQMVRYYGTPEQAPLRLCSTGCIHWYYSKLQATLWHGQHVYYRNPVIFKAETMGEVLMDACKGGSEGLTISGIPESLSKYITLCDALVFMFVLDYYYRVHDDAYGYRPPITKCTDMHKRLAEALECRLVNPYTLANACIAGPLWHIVNGFKLLITHGGTYWRKYVISRAYTESMISWIDIQLDPYKVPPRANRVLPNTYNFWNTVYSETERIVKIQQGFQNPRTLTIADDEDF